MTLSIMPVYEAADGTTLPEPLVEEFDPVSHGPMTFEAATDAQAAQAEVEAQKGVGRLLVPLALAALGMWVFMPRDAQGRRV